MRIPNTGVANNANGHASGEASKTAREAGGEVSVAVEEVIGFGFRVNAGADDDGDDQAVDSQHSGHNNRNDGFHDQLRSHDAHRSNADTALGRAVRRC